MAYGLAVTHRLGGDHWLTRATARDGASLDRRVDHGLLGAARVEGWFHFLGFLATPTGRGALAVARALCAAASALAPKATDHDPR